LPQLYEGAGPIFFVLDQSVLRDPLLQDQIAREHSRFVLPDVALIEMVKHENWESTLRRSLAFLTPIPPRIFMSASIHEVLRQEVSAGVPATRERFLRTELVNLLRDILSSLIHDAQGRFSHFKEQITSIRGDLLAEDANPEVEQRYVRDLVDRIQQRIDSRIIKDLGRGKIEMDAQLGMILRLAKGELGLTWPAFTRRPMLQKNPLTLRFHYLRLWYAMEWIRKRGLECATGSTLLNETLDQDYILTASYFDYFLTRDKKAFVAYEALRRLSRNASRVKLLEALDRYLVASKHLSRRH
jgi:hypothetical protein